MYIRTVSDRSWPTGGTGEKDDSWLFVVLNDMNLVLRLNLEQFLLPHLPVHNYLGEFAEYTHIYFRIVINQAISLTANHFYSVSMLHVLDEILFQGSLPAPTSKCARSRERTGSVCSLGSSLPGTADIFVQANIEEQQESSDGSVLSNSALVAGNVSVQDA